MALQEFLDYNLFSLSDFNMTVGRLILLLLIILFARISLKVIIRLLNTWFKRKEVDPGRRYVIIKIISYIVYVLTILLLLQSIGIKLSLLWGGAAALLVGVGLGLQQTFNDFFSGIILLLESSVAVGDVVMVNDMIATVNSIGLRTSKVETRDKIVIIIPNSKLVGDNVVNWSHNNQPSRFQVHIGVSYNSEDELVTKLLLQAAAEHSGVLKTPPPKVQLHEFADSSINFILHFYTMDFLATEFIKSDLRYRIRKLLKEHHQEIPFPQRDLWIKNPEALLNNVVNNDIRS